MHTLEYVIRLYIRLGRRQRTGFYPLKCPLCNDYKERAGFKFEFDTVGYNCFNCGNKSKFIPSEHRRIPKKLTAILDSFGVPREEYEKINFELLKNSGEKKEKKQKTVLDILPKEIKLPSFFIPFKEADKQNKWVRLITLYMQRERKIDTDSYPFYVSLDQSPFRKAWLGRIIIPFYLNGNLIYYQGRDVTGTKKKADKYKSPSVPRQNIFFNMDDILDYESTSPIFVMDGVFDAFQINGCATLANTLSHDQALFLRTNPREKIFIPDRKGDGHLLAYNAIAEGWKVSFPNIGDCKDVDEAVKRYGHLYVLKSIYENVFSGEEALLRANLLCKGEEKNVRKS